MGFLPDKTPHATTKRIGDAAEDEALQYLQAQGLRLLVRNYRTPGRGGGEIDLIMQDQDSTVVFVEVRKRKSTRHGGAAAHNYACATCPRARRCRIDQRHF